MSIATLNKSNWMQELCTYIPQFIRPNDREFESEEVLFTKAPNNIWHHD